jgi:hypothetical protein
LAKFAKILAMIVRVFFVVELVLGVLLAGVRFQYLPVHIGLGFLVAGCVALLAIMACMKRMFGIGVVGLFFAILLPITGFKQFPLKFGSQIGLIQIVHVVVALAAVGLAEALHARIRKTA